MLSTDHGKNNKGPLGLLDDLYTANNVTIEAYINIKGLVRKHFVNKKTSILKANHNLSLPKDWPGEITDKTWLFHQVFASGRHSRISLTNCFQCIIPSPISLAHLLRLVNVAPLKATCVFTIFAPHLENICLLRDSVALKLLSVFR